MKVTRKMKVLVLGAAAMLCSSQAVLARSTQGTSVPSYPRYRRVVLVQTAGHANTGVSRNVICYQGSSDCEANPADNCLATNSCDMGEPRKDYLY
ncbi:MAG: hypothetical protein CMF39_04655 [Legionellaceae bacterium]|nr:hypothetical protein [Legionellaceae bacterium]|tara:strand:- start:1940 stop:2224 length:285 start_codon:yes stop_codon:yes gene_type:complete